MTNEFFRTQLKRLQDCYGEKSFPPERANLFFKEVSILDGDGLVRIVDTIIAEIRVAPLMPEIRGLISAERERGWQIEKAQHAIDAKNFMRMLGTSDIQDICRGITKRINGEMTDENFEGFQKTLKSVADLSPLICKFCEDTGLQFKMIDGGTYVYKCWCTAGVKRREKYPTAVYDREAV